MRGLDKSAWTMIPTVASSLLLLGIAVLVAVGGIILFPPLIVALFGGLVFMALCFRNPLTGFGIVVSLFIFETALLLFPAANQADAGIINTISAPDFALAALLAVIVVKALFTKDTAMLTAARSHSLFLLLCGVLLVMCVPGLVYADSAPKGMVSLLRMMSSMVLAILALLLVRSLADIKRLACLMIPALVLAALWGWYEVLTGEYVFTKLGLYVKEPALAPAAVGHYRSIGPVGDAVYFSVILVFGVGISLILSQLAHSRWLRRISLFVLMLCAATVLTTGSRGGLIAVLILVGVYFVFAKIRHKAALLISIAAAGALGMAIYAIAVSALPLGRMATMGGEKDKTTEYRLGLYAQSSRMFVDSPIVGVGHGQFTDHQVRYFDRRTPRSSLLPHSVYFQLLAENGIIAFGLYLAILTFCSVPLLAIVLRLDKTRDRNAVAALLGLVLAYVFFATNTNLLEDDFVWISFALAQVAYRALDDSRGAADSTGRTAGVQ